MVSPLGLRRHKLQMLKGKKRQEKVREAAREAAAGPVLSAGPDNTCRCGLGNAVSGEGADGVKLFSLVKKSTSCKSCRKNQATDSNWSKTSR